MSPDDPRHGTYAGWAQHDREGSEICPPCKDARVRYQRRRPKLHSLGKPPKVPLGQDAYDVLTALLDAGLCVAELERATGSAESSVRRYLDTGPTVVVRRVTRDRIAAVDVGAVLAARLSHVGTIRRVQALARIGYSAKRVAVEAGMHEDAMELLQRGEALASSVTTRKKVARAYRALHMKPLDPTHDKYVSRVMNKAKRNGWPPPLAWDNIDDPAERPKGLKEERRTRRKREVDPAVVARRIAGDTTVPMTHAERLEVVRQCRDKGWSYDQIEKVAGVQKVDRYVRELNATEEPRAS